MSKIPPIASPVMPLPSRESSDIFYLDVLRAKYGSEVYEIDRFVEVFKIENNVWALKQTSPASNIDGNWAYLIEGPEKAALIDNGYGVGNLKGLCEMLVNGKEVMSIVSHCHLDHANGSHQWPEIWCHEACADNLEKKKAEKTNHFTDSDWYVKFRRPIITDDVLIPRADYKINALKDHDLINLGEDYDIELIHVGGHTPGLAVFLDKKGRALYTADAAFETLEPYLGIGLDLRGEPGEFLHEGYLDIRYYAKKLGEVADRIAEYDVCRDAHGSIDSKNQVIPDLRDAINAVIEDPFAYTSEVENWFGKAYIMQRGIANCRYADPATVLDKFVMTDDNI